MYKILKSDLIMNKHIWGSMFISLTLQINIYDS